jgi:drug/metabolite transporter (DMT)-like permease
VRLTNNVSSYDLSKTIPFAMGSEFLAIVYGLASAASWGSGDFSGGLASRRGSVYSVVIISQLIGVVFLVTLALSLVESIPSADNLILGGIAGVSGAIGLVALYLGLASGRMGVVAPVTAVVAAAIPVLFSLLTKGLPATSQLVGFGMALMAVWLLSSGGDGGAIRARELGLVLTAGFGFGLFFILIDGVSQSAVFWPLVAARIASVSFLIILTTIRRGWERPARTQLSLIALAGIFDTGGNAFFALATRMGRLDIAAVLSSLYPAATVLLAWLILKERLMLQQWLGVAAALAALIFIAGGSNL